MYTQIFRLICFVGLVWLLWVLPVNLSHAQDELIYPQGAMFTFVNDRRDTGATFINFPEVEWQADSLSFRFQFQQQTTASLLEYQVESNVLHIIERSGQCAFTFSAAQENAFGAVGCPRTISPNGGYVVYPIEEQICGEACSHLLALGDLETGAQVTIRKPADAGYFVRWSRDSSALLIMDYGIVGGLGGIWYAAVPAAAEWAADLSPILLANFSQGDVGFVDISPDGEQVLIRGDGNTYKGITLWDTRLDSSGRQFAAWADGQVLLENEVIAGASFVPDDSQHLLVVLEPGIVRYDLQTDAKEVINAEVSARWVDWATFSPDTRYVLAYDNWPNDLDTQQVSLFRVGQS